MNYKKLIWVLLIVALVIRLAILPFTTVSGDACWHASVSKYIAEHKEIPLFQDLGRPVFWAPPLFHILTALLYLGFGTVKLLPVIAGILSLLFIYLIGKELFSERVGFFAALFVAFIPDHIYMSTMAYVDTTLTLFVLGAIYFAIRNKMVLAGIFSGLAMLTKYDAVFGLLAVVYIIIINNKNKWKSKLAWYSIITVLIGSWWYVRNWILLGNPVWDFLNNIFHGYVLPETAMRSPSILNIFNLGYVQTLYTSMFGIPPGTWDKVMALPFGAVFMGILLTGTLIYLAPILLGLKQLDFGKRSWQILIVLILSYALFALLYVYDAGDLYARFLMPCYLVLGIIWAKGTKKQKGMKRSMGKVHWIFIIIIMFCFAGVEFAKAEYTSRQWEPYAKDFEWVHNNIPINATMLIADSQCLPYHLERAMNSKNPDYIFEDKMKWRANILNITYDGKRELIYKNKDTKIWKVAK